MSNYEPGTVAVATVYDEPNVRVFRSGKGWQSPKAWCSDSRVTDVRPLVVLDLDVPDFVARALRLAADVIDNGRDGYEAEAQIIRSAADQIEAQTRPPRIPEPGLWGVVEASVDGIPRRRWVHHEEDHWVCDTGERRYWDALIDPSLVREGVPA